MCRKLYIFVPWSSTFIPPKMCRNAKERSSQFQFEVYHLTISHYTKIIEAQVGAPADPSGPSPSTWRVAFFRMFEEFGFEAAWNSGDTVLSPGGGSCNLFSLLLRLPQLIRIGVDCHFRISLVAHNCVLNCGNWKSIGEQDGEIMVCTPY